MSKLCFLISVQCPSLMVENVLKGNGCQADSLSPPASHPPALQHCQAGEVDLSAWVPSQLRQGASPPCGTCRVAPHAGSRGHLGCGAQKAAPEPGAGLGLGLFPSSLVSNHLISVIPFSSGLQSSPASGSFPVSQFFASGSQSTGVSVSASVFPMNIHPHNVF